MDEAAEKLLNEAQNLEDALTLFTSLATHTLQQGHSARQQPGPVRTCVCSSRAAPALPPASPPAVADRSMAAVSYRARPAAACTGPRRH